MVSVISLGPKLVVRVISLGPDVVKIISLGPKLGCGKDNRI